MDFPVMYKISSGKTLMWHIWVEQKDGITNLMAESGYVGGKIKVPVPREVVAKAGRTVLEQAKLEAESKIRNKTREGYSTYQATTNVEEVRPMLAKDYSPEVI